MASPRACWNVPSRANGSPDCTQRAAPRSVRSRICEILQVGFTVRTSLCSGNPKRQLRSVLSSGGLTGSRCGVAAPMPCSSSSRLKIQGPSGRDRQRQARHALLPCEGPRVDAQVRGSLRQGEPTAIALAIGSVARDLVVAADYAIRSHSRRISPLALFAARCDSGRRRSLRRRQTRASDRIASRVLDGVCARL